MFRIPAFAEARARARRAREAGDGAEQDGLRRRRRKKVSRTSAAPLLHGVRSRRTPTTRRVARPGQSRGPARHPRTSVTDRDGRDKKLRPGLLDAACRCCATKKKSRRRRTTRAPRFSTTGSPPSDVLPRRTRRIERRPRRSRARPGRGTERRRGGKETARGVAVLLVEVHRPGVLIDRDPWRRRLVFSTNVSRRLRATIHAACEVTGGEKWAANLCQRGEASHRSGGLPRLRETRADGRPSTKTTRAKKKRRSKRSSFFRLDSELG